MPKSTSASSPNPTNKHDDVAMRKKKNADAQAAFRARRATYISTLEETVTNLEGVVLNLQSSWKASENRTRELRLENDRLRVELRECDRVLRSGSWPRKPDHDDHLPPPSMSGSSNGHIDSTYSTDVINYRPQDPSVCAPQYSASGSQPYPNQLAFDGNSSVEIQRSKYPHYFQQPLSRDVSWPPQSMNSSPVENTTSTQRHSSDFSESPTLTSPATNTFMPREDHKLAMTTVDASAYPLAYPSRPVSPSTTMSSASSTLASPFPFFPDTVSHDRCEYDYRRQSLPQSPELAFYSSATNMSLSTPGYKGGQRRAESLLASLPVCGNIQDDACPSNDEPYVQTRARSRLHATARSSRSPSPSGTVPLSSTLAVIKAQAFGALRRTRSSKVTKKALDAPMKVEESETSDYGIGVHGVKRQRLEYDLDA